MSEGSDKKLSIYTMFSTDVSMEKSGIRVRFGDSVFVVARSGGSNERFRKVAEAKLRPHRRRIETATIGEDEMRTLMIEIFVDSVLLSWEGVLDQKHEEIAFSRDNAMNLLRELPDLFAALQEEAKMAANFRALELDTDAKN